MPSLGLTLGQSPPPTTILPFVQVPPARSSARSHPRAGGCLPSFGLGSCSGRRPPTLAPGGGSPTGASAAAGSRACGADAPWRLRGANAGGRGRARALVPHRTRERPGAGFTPARILEPQILFGGATGQRTPQQDP